jgi:hypothetical protein
MSCAAGGTCSWNILADCPPQPTAPCVAGSAAVGTDGGLNTACNTCLTATCGAAWDCCGSDPTQIAIQEGTYGACIVLTSCVLQDLAQSESYATALPACEATRSYNPATESAAETLVQCYMAQCTPACADSM